MSFDSLLEAVPKCMECRRLALDARYYCTKRKDRGLVAGCRFYRFGAMWYGRLLLDRKWMWRNGYYERWDERRKQNVLARNECDVFWERGMK